MIDDSTAVYIIETRKCFEDLRQVASQIAGVLVLAESGAKSATPDHPLLKAARELHQEALDFVRSARPTPQARLHHRCLVEAAEALTVALAASQRLDSDAVLPPVRAAYAHLEGATRALPGFQMVEFKQGCCALHTKS